MKRVLPAALALVVGGVGCREHSRPDPNVRMAIAHTPEEPAASPGGKPRIPTRMEVPPEVEKAYSGIRLAWKDSQSGSSGVLEVPLGADAPVPGSSLQVRGDVYLPAFTMSSDAITSAGTEESNPAARIAVAEDGKEIFAGWIFKNFPDVHPFQHPRFSLRLEGGVRRASK
jgi:hypothetical protein